MTLPVPRTEASVEQPHIELGEDESSEDDLGPSPSFEIVDGQLMSAQRPRATESNAKKRTREDLSEPEYEVEAPAHEGSRVMSLDQRIHYMFPVPETAPPPPSVHHAVATTHQTREVQTNSKQPRLVISCRPSWIQHTPP